MGKIRQEKKKNQNFLIMRIHTRAFGYGVDFASRGVGAAAAKKRDTNATNVVFPRDDAKKAEADSFPKNQGRRRRSGENTAKEEL